MNPVIVRLDAAALVGWRLERLVIDRRFDQLVLFLSGDAPVELVYHRVDADHLRFELLQRLAEERAEVTSSTVAHGQDEVLHRLGFGTGDEVEVRSRDANAVVGGA